MTAAPRTTGALAERAASGHIAWVLHLTKLAVGIRDIDHLAEVQAERQRSRPPLRHLTRNVPRRAAELLDGGSLYWVVAGSMLARQRLRDIVDDQWHDGTRCCALVLEPKLVPLIGRPIRAFQGWRYLADADAPSDRVPGIAASAEAELPPTLRRELRALGLL